MIERRTRIITKDQLESGWFTFRPDRIPNVVRHEFEVKERMASGHYVVFDPEADVDDQR